MAERPSRRMHALKLVAFALFPAALILITAETCATLAIARVVRRTKDPATAQTKYTMRIGKFPWSRTAVTMINSQGFPDVEFKTLPAKNGCVHVVFVGDSFIFGDGVNADSSFVGLIKRWSTDRAPRRCVRVFNLGVRGTTIDRQAAIVRETLPQLQPDVVILGQYQNDLTDLAHPNISADSVQGPERETDMRSLLRNRFGSLKLNVVRFLAYHAFGAAIKNNVHYDLLRHWSVLVDPTRSDEAARYKTTYEAEYASLVRELAQRDIDFGVVILPSKFDVLAGRFPEEAFFTDLANKYGVPHLSAFPVLDKNRSPYAFLMYDGHLNELGNRLVAQTVYKWMYETQPAPFAQLRILDASDAKTGATL